MDCPYCHNPGPHSLAGSRYICGKCSESFLPAMVGDADEPVDLAGNVLNSRQMRQKRGMISVRRAFLICCSFAVMSFVLGLAYRWYHARNADPGAEIASQARPYAPLMIPALRFLPGDVDGVAAVQLQHLRGSETVSTRFAAIIRELNVPESWLQQLPERLGTDWSNVLEVALALKTGQRLVPPQIWMVLHLREPIDEDDIYNLSRGRRVERGKRHFMRFQGPSGVPLVGWQPVEKYYVLALDESDFDLLPERTRPDSSHLNPRLVSQLNSFGTDDMLAWLAFDAAGLPATTGTVLSAFSPTGSKWLSRIDLVNLGLRIDPDAELGAWIEAKDEATAKGWRESMLKSLADQPGKAQVGGGGRICYLKIDFDAGIVKKLLSGLAK